MFRTALAVSFAALTAGCAAGSHNAYQAITPTEQFAIKVTPAPDEVLLAPHPAGLSPNQQAALSDLADRWRDGGEGPISIQAPVHGGPGAGRVGGDAERALLAMGVPRDAVRLAGYDAGEDANAPVRVGFTHYVAEGPQCGRDWPNLSISYQNAPPPNFGCAGTANMAAQIANPADLLHPRTMTPADAGRRETVLGKYRSGDNTSTSADSQAKGAVSQAIQ